MIDLVLMEDKKYTVKKEQYSIEFGLFSKNKMIVVGIVNNKLKSIEFEDQHLFNDFRDESDIFLRDWASFYKLINYTFQQKQQNLIFKEGQLQISYQITVLGMTQIKQIIFKLKTKLLPNQEITILKQRVSNYEEQVQHLKNQVICLKQINKQILARLSLVEQLLVQSKQTNYFDKKSEQKPPKAKSQQKPQFIFQSKQAIKIVQDQVEQNVKISLNVDPKSQNYSKFKLDPTKITSLEQDYYQVYWKDPLPKKGIARASVKMSARNHFSIGILASSERKNQYSFQNKKCVCLYSYFDGSYRGVYAEGKYTPLQWKMELNQVIQMTINITERKMVFGIKGKSTAIEIAIQTLIQKLEENQRLFFFLQMYEKDNVLQFL